MAALVKLDSNPVSSFFSFELKFKGNRLKRKLTQLGSRMEVNLVRAQNSVGRQHRAQVEKALGEFLNIPKKKVAMQRVEIRSTRRRLKVGYVVRWKRRSWPVEQTRGFKSKKKGTGVSFTQYGKPQNFARGFRLNNRHFIRRAGAKRLERIRGPVLKRNYGPALVVKRRLKPAVAAEWRRLMRAKV